MLLKRLNITTNLEMDECIYFYERHGMGIFKYDKYSGSVKCVWKDPKPNYYKYSDVICDGNKLIFAPFQADNILIYDMTNSNVEYIPIGEMGECIRIVSIGGKHYFIRQKNNYIAFDLNTKNYNIKQYEGDVKCTSYSNVCVVGEKIFIPMNRKGSVMEIDVMKDNTILHILNDDMIFNTIAYADDRFWLSGNNDYLVVWNPLNESITRISLIDILEKRKIDWKGMFSSSILVNNYIIFAPLISSHILRINIHTYEMATIMRMPKEIVCWCICEWKQDEIYISLENVNGLTQKDFILTSNGDICEEDIMCIYDKNASDFIQETHWDNLKRFIQNEIAGI